MAKSCKPVKVSYKSTNNYYSAATSWSTTEFPLKRKGREEEEPEDERKRGRWEENKGGKAGDCFKRKDGFERGSCELSRRISKHSSRSSRREDRNPLAEKQENIDAAEARYKYRAPYQDDCGTEERPEGGNCEGASGNLNGNLDNMENQNGNYAKYEDLSEPNVKVSPVSEEIERGSRESRRRSSKHSSRSSRREERKPLDEKQENIDAAKAKYKCRAPYQADTDTEERSRGGNCEGVSGNLNGNFDHTENQYENYPKNEDFASVVACATCVPEANIKVPLVSENDIDVNRN